MIETYIITWNSELYIHLTINYYKAFSKVIVYDNFSTDRTREVCEQLGAEVRLFGQAGVLDDAAYLSVKNHCWKGSKADWVIVIDDDEILSLRPEDYTGTLIHPQGYGMYSNEMPKENWLEVNTGTQDDNYSKLCCFNPKQITDINFIYGCHEARPRGNVDIRRGGSLYHYRAVGGIERLLARHRSYREKQWGAMNIKWNLAHHYKQDEKDTRKWFAENLEKSVRLF